MVSSATLRVDACGALNTGTPFCAAARMSTWSVPTVKQPMASSRDARARCSARSLVRDRTPTMCDAATADVSSSPSRARGIQSTE